MAYTGMIREEIFEGAIVTSSGALGAIAVGSPIGPAGGALGAALGWLVGKPVQYLTESLFNTNRGTASLVSRIAQLVVHFFANAAVFMLSSSWLGTPISFKASCILAGVTLGISLAIAMFVCAVKKVSHI